MEKSPEALGDYRKWLEEHGIDTNGMRPMGGAEATMSVFAKRLKNGCSWGDNGVSAMMTGLVAYLIRWFLDRLWTNGPVDREQGGNEIIKVLC